jgi:hypothetical protein
MFIDGAVQVHHAETDDLSEPAAPARAGAANAGPADADREESDRYFPPAGVAYFALSWPMEMPCAGVAARKTLPQ